MAYALVIFIPAHIRAADDPSLSALQTQLIFFGLMSPAILAGLSGVSLLCTPCTLLKAALPFLSLLVLVLVWLGGYLWNLMGRGVAAMSPDQKRGS